MNVLEGLNEHQREAAEYLEGPLLILAGAGSGKTRTIISRIANILDNGYAWPSQILAITFTNKAANEMRERVAALDIPETNQLWMSTFHSACAKILRMYGERLGYTSHFKIFDSDDQKVLVRKLMKEKGLNTKKYTPASVVATISNCKNKQYSPEELLESSRTQDDKIIAEIYKTYDEQLKSYNAMDFDDLILKTNQLLRENEDVLNYFQRKFKYILVDEYQDSNASQYEFVQLLAGGYRNLCVCGDDDQSIVRP